MIYLLFIIFALKVNIFVFYEITCYNFFYDNNFIVLFNIYKLLNFNHLIIFFLLLLIFYILKLKSCLVIAYCINIFEFINLGELDFNLFYLLLLNDPINKIHPILFYISLVFSLSKLNRDLTKIKYQFYINLVTNLLLTIYLGCFWSLKESQWNSWWDWDISEVFSLYLFIALIIILHTSKTISTKKLTFIKIPLGLWILLYFFLLKLIFSSNHIFLSAISYIFTPYKYYFILILLFLYTILNLVLLTSFLTKYRYRVSYKIISYLTCLIIIFCLLVRFNNLKLKFSFLLSFWGWLTIILWFNNFTIIGISFLNPLNFTFKKLSNLIWLHLWIIFFLYFSLYNFEIILSSFLNSYNTITFLSIYGYNQFILFNKTVSSLNNLVTVIENFNYSFNFKFHSLQQQSLSYITLMNDFLGENDLNHLLIVNLIFIIIFILILVLFRIIM